MESKEKYEINRLRPVKKEFPFVAPDGFTILEMLIAMAIFSVLMSAIFAVYSTQLKHTSREYRIAESEVEVGIAKGIIERDLSLGGYGLADDYSDATLPNGPFSPMSFKATDANPDTLTLMGTALGLNSRYAQGWSYLDTTAPTFGLFSSAGSGHDVREELGTDVRAVIIEPSTKKLMTEGGKWLFRVQRTNATPADRITTVNAPAPLTNKTVGNIVYGLYSSTLLEATQPYYAVRYYLGGTSPSNCAPNTLSLLRAEDKTTETPAGGDPLLACVLDMEVAFGLDTNNDNSIDFWDNGGTQAALYDSKTLNSRLKQVRVYLLLQVGNLDTGYTAPSPIWVGEQTLGAGTGRSVALTSSQQNYRWKVLTLNVTPRNVR